MHSRTIVETQDIALLELTRGKWAIIDPEDLPRVRAHTWYAHRQKKAYYVFSHINGKQTSLHRFILKAPRGMHTDHRNNNGLDCRKSNMRLCTVAQNNCNRAASPNKSSRYKGVYWAKDKQKWRASVTKNHKRAQLGYFATEEEAAKAYNTRASILHGDFAFLNMFND